jgi:hypothetical protein
MFLSTPDFGLTILVILDNHLQRFFEMVSEMDDVTKASSRERDFLCRQANAFLDGLENRQPPSVVIPQCLRRTPTVDNGNGTGGETPPTKKKKKTATSSEKLTNSEPQQAWSIPEGKAYKDHCQQGGANELGWPKLKDARFESDRSMCMRFQVKGECTKRCTLAHITKSKMTAKQDADGTARFKKICRS